MAPIEMEDLKPWLEKQTESLEQMANRLEEHLTKDESMTPPPKEQQQTEPLEELEETTEIPIPPPEEPEPEPEEKEETSQTSAPEKQKGIKAFLDWLL